MNLTTPRSRSDVGVSFPRELGFDAGVFAHDDEVVDERATVGNLQAGCQALGDALRIAPNLPSICSRVTY